MEGRAALRRAGAGFSGVYTSVSCAASSLNGNCGSAVGEAAGRPGPPPHACLGQLPSQGGFSQELISALQRLPGFLGSGRPRGLSKGSQQPRPRELGCAVQRHLAATPLSHLVIGGLAAVCRTHS